MHSQLAFFEDDKYLAELSQWYTPSDLAERTVRWALEGVREPIRILEPSAGLGALIRPIPDQHHVTAYEIDPRRMFALEDLGVSSIRCVDYLNHWTEERYELAIMNPPYEGDQDAFHVRKAVLSDADRVVAILRLAALQGVSKWSKVWSVARITRMAICIRRQVFHGPVGGTPSGGTAVVEMVARKQLGQRGRPDEMTTEWW